MITKKTRNRGVITVLVAGLLVGMLSLGTLVLELGRYVAAKTQLAAAADSTATSMIASFDPDMYERYGLMVIDTDSFTMTRCEDYLRFNSDLDAAYSSNNLSTMYNLDTVEMTGLYNLTYPAVLKRQLLSRAKYHVVPTDYALNMDTVQQFFADLENKCSYVAGKMDAILAAGNAGAADAPAGEMAAAINALTLTFNQSMEGKTTSVITNPDYDLQLSAASVARLPSTTGTVQSPSTAEDEQMIGSTVLDAIGQTGVDISSLATATAYTETDISMRCLQDMEALAAQLDSGYTGAVTGTYLPSWEVAQRIKAVTQSIPASAHMLQSDMEGNLLLNSYITGYFSNKNRAADSYMAPSTSRNFSASADNTTFYSACAEYLIGGSASETENQSAAYRSMLAIRLINNLYMLLNQSGYNQDDPQSVSAYLAWAYYESCADMWLLSQYNIAVPLNKNQPLLPLNEPGRVAQAFASHDFADGMDKLGWHNGTTFVIPGSAPFSYTDSIALAMWFVPNSQKLLRVADLIQLEMRYREQYVDGGAATFLMSEQNTYCRVKVSAKLRAILPIISLGGSGTIQGTAFQTVRYAGY